jgi:hypothetical protein
MFGNAFMKLGVHVMVVFLILLLPVFTGPARTVGAAYHSPHVPLDDGYQAHCPGQSSPVGISR